MGFASAIVPIFIVGILFIGLPWIVLHYVTHWKTAATLTGEDEALLDQMLDTARRLEDRLATIERIIAADHPEYRSGVHGQPELRTELRHSTTTPPPFPSTDHDLRRN